VIVDCVTGRRSGQEHRGKNAKLVCPIGKASARKEKPALTSKDKTAAWSEKCDGEENQCPGEEGPTKSDATKKKIKMPVKSRKNFAKSKKKRRAAIQNKVRNKNAVR